MTLITEFRDVEPMVDDDLRLVIEALVPSEPHLDRVPAYRFCMYRTDDAQLIGRIDLRLGNTPYLVQFAGHIGYRVEPAFRGRRYAARSLGLLLPLAALHGLNPIWITCNPDNAASKRTCELAGGELVDIVSTPRGSSMYRAGETRKCRYRFTR